MSSQQPDNSASDKPEKLVPNGKHPAMFDVAGLAGGFLLIMLAIWTPDPLQRWVDWATLAWILAVTAVSFDGLAANGLRELGLLKSLWIVAAALAIAIGAVVFSRQTHSLHAPHSAIHFLHRYWLYAVWALFQEFLILDFFLRRLLRLTKNTAAAIAVTAILFTLAHLPNPVLVPLALAWGLIACALFLRYRNVYTLGMAHAILGICIAITVPGHLDHNMRVGMGYLTYRPHYHRHFQRNQIPQTVSTTACVMADAPTRRS